MPNDPKKPAKRPEKRPKPEKKADGEAVGALGAIAAFPELPMLIELPELSDKFRALNQEEQAALLFMANNILLGRMTQDEIYADPKRLNAMINAVLNQEKPGRAIKEHVKDYRAFMESKGVDNGEGR